MPLSTFELAVLMSLDCCSTSLFPSFLDKERKEITSHAREFISLAYPDLLQITSILEKDLKKEKVRHAAKRCLDAIYATNPPFSERLVTRYLSRLDIGFTTAQDLPSDLAACIGKAQTSILNLELDTDLTETLIDDIARLDDFSRTVPDQCGSFGDELAGSLSESHTPWDTKVTDLIDHEYDQPFVITIAIKLKPMTKEFDFLFQWRKALSPPSYEAIRRLLIDEIKSRIVDIQKVHDIEKYITPM